MRSKPGLFFLLAASLCLHVPAMAERPRVGEIFPEISGVSISGETISLSQFRGKPVLVDLWATWCPPCMEEMPHLSKIYDDFHDKGFEIIGISLDYSLDTLKNYIDGSNVKWPILFSEGGWRSKWPQKLEVNAIPAFFLLDAEGKLVSKNARRERLEAWLTHLLDPTVPEPAFLVDLFDAWRDYSGEKRKQVEERILKLAGSPEHVDEANGRLWMELMRPFLERENLPFLLRLSERITETSPNPNCLDTHAYALYLNGQYARAASTQEKAVREASQETNQDDYLWLMEARWALYLAKAGDIQKASKVFQTALEDRDRAEEVYYEKVDWLAEAADILDIDYAEEWANTLDIDQRFYSTRCRGNPKRIEKRYQLLLNTLNIDDGTKEDYAIFYGHVGWPEEAKEILATRDNLPVRIRCLTPDKQRLLSRVYRVAPNGDFGLLVDVPDRGNVNRGGKANLVINGRGIRDVTREIQIRPGEVQNLGSISLASDRSTKGS